MGELTPATDPRFGDYQTNAALILAVVVHDPDLLHPSVLPHVGDLGLGDAALPRQRLQHVIHEAVHRLGHRREVRGRQVAVHVRGAGVLAEAAYDPIDGLGGQHVVLDDVVFPHAESTEQDGRQDAGKDHRHRQQAARAYRPARMAAELV